MPALSPTMEEGRLARWLVREGEKISAGDVIAEIETDKATMEVEAAEDGLLSRLLVSEGTDGVKVNTPIAIMIDEDEQAEPEAGARPDAGSGREGKETEKAGTNKDASARTDDKNHSPMPPCAALIPARKESAPEISANLVGGGLSLGASPFPVHPF